MFPYAMFTLESRDWTLSNLSFTRRDVAPLVKNLYSVVKSATRGSLSNYSVDANSGDGDFIFVYFQMPSSPSDYLRAAEALKRLTRGGSVPIGTVRGDTVVINGSIDLVADTKGNASYYGKDYISLSDFSGKSLSMRASSPLNRFVAKNSTAAKQDRVAGLIADIIASKILSPDGTHRGLQNALNSLKKDIGGTPEHDDLEESITKIMGAFQGKDRLLEAMHLMSALLKNFKKFDDAERSHMIFAIKSLLRRV
jgi:hypothetical protein